MTFSEETKLRAEIEQAWMILNAERNTHAERVRVLREALQGLLAGEDAECTLESYAAASERARAALEQTNDR
jgi:hypothetical protein